MDNRKEDREKKQIRIRLKDESGIYSAVITSISKAGVSVKTSHSFPAFKVIDVLVKAARQKITIKGSVRWVNPLPAEGDEQQYEIGISLQNPPPEYTRHFD
ncbi:MAG: PilZ domain-containing protein [bacterium]|nr:PilZ domain-containing protein [bacterium]